MAVATKAIQVLRHSSTVHHTTPQLDRKLRVEDIPIIITDPRAGRQRALLTLLLREPLTLRTASEF